MSLDVPEEFDEWPFEARSFVLAEANTAAELRQAICNHTGMSFEDVDDGHEGKFTKEQMAVLVRALGGPDGDGS